MHTDLTFANVNQRSCLQEFNPTTPQAENERVRRWVSCGNTYSNSPAAC